MFKRTKQILHKYYRHIFQKELNMSDWIKRVVQLDTVYSVHHNAQYTFFFNL